MSEWTPEEMVEGLRSFSATDRRERFYEACAETIECLSSKITTANARERKAYMAGFWDGYETDPVPECEPDEEQAWQQYRCQDDSDWKVVSKEDAAKIDAAVSTEPAHLEGK